MSRSKYDEQVIREMLQSGNWTKALSMLTDMVFEEDTLEIAGMTIRDTSRITIFDNTGHSVPTVPGELACVGMLAPNGVAAYQVPAGKRLVIRATRSDNPLQLGYADDAAPVDGNPVDGNTLTNPVYQGGIPAVSHENPPEAVCEFVIPAGKYPFSGLTNGGSQSWQIFGELLDA